MSLQVKISLTSSPVFSRLFVFGWLFAYIITRTSHVSSKISILCSRGKNNMRYEILLLPLEHAEFITSRHRVISCIYFCGAIL